MSDQPIFDEFGNLIEDVEDIENIDEQQDYDDDEEERVARDEQQNGHTTAADGDGDEPMVQEEEEDSHVEFKTRQPGNAIVLHEDKQYYPDASEVYGQDVEVMVQDEDTQPISKPVIDPGSKRSFLVADKELPDTSFSKEFLVDMMAHPQLMRNKVLLELGIRLSRETLNLDVKPLLRIVLSSFFGKATGFVDMVVDLPSPLDNAEQKASFVYTGPLNGTYGEALKKCDPNGPLVVYVTKLLTNDAGTGFDCLGRVLSGTVRRSSEVRVLGERYSIDTNEEDLVLEELTKVSIGEARYKIDVDSIPAGMWCLLEGIDSSIIKTATIVNERDPKMTNYTNGNSNVAQDVGRSAQDQQVVSAGGYACRRVGRTHHIGHGRALPRLRAARPACHVRRH
ncbi:U5 small nuclear ribonucleoprotein subunit [Cavenderia fasciculata]|uniref:U5 small nuclear ribonucleoprotein subunit n=1 Tax=Cavenderia fasciculata TaxID=261658 RepID=F4Q4H5_CACFS|nr:U5 small nuclear ribonucleoprotein subunit [Cavenderia fasciculata]EGG17824.1 U5 small nuclear ribonucleoprotein subunit [Cavenderia fasciculata]|eukprot:XP_004356308.1 U5 small nuclear ribonucleoprotein subunit [Cavenderia fasciculata]